MAKLTTKDQALVIESTLTNKALARAEKYFPEVLTLTKKDEDDKTVPYFGICTSATGSVSKAGIEFIKGCDDEQAQVTITIPKMGKTKKVEYVKDTYGSVLRNLQLIEANYDKASKDFDEAYAKLDNAIVIE